MPEVLADEHANAPEAGVKSAHRLPRGKKTTFVKKPIGRKIHFSMDMLDLSILKIDSRIEKPIFRR